jgi:hypothetical protein
MAFHFRAFIKAAWMSSLMVVPLSVITAAVA